jgi:4a-hydroxytetrahydrobiopterin dehydratase
MNEFTCLKEKNMSAQSLEELRARKCVPCEGGVPKLSKAEAEAQLAKLVGWSITVDGQRIRKEWNVKHFMAGMRFFNLVAEIAEAEAHHPDLHLVGFRNVAVEIWTHAIGGLSENDFILAAKIDELPIQLKSV